MQSEFSRMVKWNKVGISVAHQDSSNLYVSLMWASKIAGGCHSLEPVCRVGCCTSRLYRCLRAEVMVWADLGFCVWVFWRWLCSIRLEFLPMFVSRVLFPAVFVISVLFLLPTFFFISFIPTSMSWHFLLVNLAWSQMPLSSPTPVFSSKLLAW